MLTFSYLVIFLFGLIVGSFLNSLIYRLQTGESFLFKRSFCPHCKHQLSWRDLIPIFSFLILRGKCRYCKKPISWQYPLVELAAGIIFLSVFNIHSIIITFFFFLFSCFLIIIFVYDLRYYLIPDKIIYPAIATALLYSILYSFSILNTICAAFGAAAFFLVIVLISRGKWMGVGDIKLAFFMGLFLAFPNILVALFLAFFIGAIIGVGLIITGKKTLKSEVPFGPFLVTGTFMAMFWGQKIINWYLNFWAGL
jgi:leader peptidase (prepilin peptidase)/N-methyltransferase